MFNLAIRIPSYVKEFTVCINGKHISEEEQLQKEGYLYLNRKWSNKDNITFDFEMPVRRTYCNPLVRANENCVALQRGPLVYCFEGLDNGENIQELRIPENAEFYVKPVSEGTLSFLFFLGKQGGKSNARVDV